VLTSLVVITLFVPCIASAAVILKERGKFETALTIMGSWVMAFAFGAILTRLLEWIPLL
jgi:ferrous iron transport protein B